MKKKFWQSKAKWGALLLALSTLLGVVGNGLQGSVDAAALLQAVWGFGVALGIWGVRDALK